MRLKSSRIDSTNCTHDEAFDRIAELKASYVAAHEQAMAERDRRIETERRLDAAALKANDMIDQLAASNLELQRRLGASLERIERLRDWIQDRVDDCPYGEMDFEACGHNRKHGICSSHAAAKVLAQDTFVSDPVVEKPAPISESQKCNHCGAPVPCGCWPP